LPIGHLVERYDGAGRDRRGGPPGGRSGDRLFVAASSPDGRMRAAAGSDADIRLRDLGELPGADIRKNSQPAD
jgi:hypothetical protein